jgi:F-type H+-transporting ATPase subunit epsilon|tara:strand:- start:499 stop:729 length:231 start_codon:yes stop_codon:yes gene_type:complete
MQLEIITPDKVLYTGDIIGVKVPGKAGSFEVLNNHAPLISSLDKGVVRVKDAQGSHNFEISGGIIEVMGNKVIVLT